MRLMTFLDSEDAFSMNPEMSLHIKTERGK